jgi:hypothetical protein
MQDAMFNTRVGLLGWLHHQSDWILLQELMHLPDQNLVTLKVEAAVRII